MLVAFVLAGGILLGAATASQRFVILDEQIAGDKYADACKKAGLRPARLRENCTRRVLGALNEAKADQVWIGSYITWGEDEKGERVHKIEYLHKYLTICVKEKRSGLKVTQVHPDDPQAQAMATLRPLCVRSGRRQGKVTESAVSWRRSIQPTQPKTPSPVPLAVQRKQRALLQKPTRNTKAPKRRATVGEERPGRETGLMESYQQPPKANQTVPVPAKKSKESKGGKLKMSSQRGKKSAKHDNGADAHRTETGKNEVVIGWPSNVEMYPFHALVDRHIVGSSVPPGSTADHHQNVHGAENQHSPHQPRPSQHNASGDNGDEVRESYRDLDHDDDGHDANDHDQREVELDSGQIDEAADNS